jgi:ketosteroid isomerase-like protein
MTTTTAPTPDLAAARARNEATWRDSCALMYAGRIEEFMGFWTEDARYEAALPAAGMPPVVEGRDALGAVFASFTAMAERIEAHDVRFHQTDDPDVAIVEERLVADLAGGGRYDNRMVMRVTFRGDRIAEMVEYYGQHAHEALIRRLMETAH